MIIISSESDTFFVAKNQEASFATFDEQGVRSSKLELFDGDQFGDSGVGFWDRFSTDVLSFIYDEQGYNSNIEDWRDSNVNFESVGEWREFDQTEFAEASAFNSGDLEGKENGWVYIPNQCTSGTLCRAHFVFHAGEKDASFLGESKGYNLLGYLNNIIMVYP